jgi:hypothetical protein
MGDIYCKFCGEPWDAFGVLHGDMTREEAKRFLRGEGCPCCNFGRKREKYHKEAEREFWDSLGEIFLE